MLDVRLQVVQGTSGVEVVCGGGYWRQQKKTLLQVREEVIVIIQRM